MEPEGTVRHAREDSADVVLTILWVGTQTGLEAGLGYLLQILPSMTHFPQGPTS